MYGNVSLRVALVLFISGVDLNTEEVLSKVFDRELKEKFRVVPPFVSPRRVAAVERRIKKEEICSKILVLHAVERKKKQDFTAQPPHHKTS